MTCRRSHPSGVFVSHSNTRSTTVHGRRLLVDRVRRQGWAAAHAAKATAISRQCAHRWVARFDAHGEVGLVDRSSAPHHSPNRTSEHVEEQVLTARKEHRRGQDWAGSELGLGPRIAARVLRRHDVPYLRECDPLTGQVIRSSKTTSRNAHGLTATTSTPPSTTTPAWPTPRSSPTRKAPPVQRFRPGPLATSPTTASPRSNAS